MTVEIGGKNWAQWNWMDRFGTGPIPTMVNEMLSFFAAVNPNHPGHELSMLSLPDRGNPAIDIGFRIGIQHPSEAWSVLMRCQSMDPHIQHLSRSVLTLQWLAGYEALYNPNGSGLAYGDFDSPYFLTQLGMTYIDYPGVSGTVLMFRDTTPGKEYIFFWLANHGEPVALTDRYAPQWFYLAWREEINSWMFTSVSYRNEASTGGTLQSGWKLFTPAMYPSGAIQSTLRYGNQSFNETMTTNPFMLLPSLDTSWTRGVLVPGVEGVRFYYPPFMVTGFFRLSAVAGLPFDGNRLHFPDFPMLYQLGSWSSKPVYSPTTNSEFSDDYAFFYLPDDHVVPAGWLPADQAYPWRDPPSINAGLLEFPRQDLIQASYYTPDGETGFWPSLSGLQPAAENPFFQRFAADQIGGGGGGGGSSRPGAGVLWPRRG